MSYSNYSTYLKYKNCCRPIGDTGPQGPSGPPGPTITGNKGEVLYFGETDTLVSTDNIFIQEGNVIIDGATTFNNSITVLGNINGNTIHTQRLLFPGGDYFDYQTGLSRLYVTGNTFLQDNVVLFSTIDISGDAILRSNLNITGPTTLYSNLYMNNRSINNISDIYFTKGSLTFDDFSSVNQNISLPSSQGQPISLERKTLFYDQSFDINTGSASIDISFVNPTFNQMNFSIGGPGNTIISTSPDISGQYVEIYANFLIQSNNGNSKTMSLDISGVSFGSLFKETIDVRSISKQGKYYITYGPHIFSPQQWSNTNDFVITANTTDDFTIEQYKLMFKSYFM